jgi:phosphate butyryltransferase
LDLNKLLDKATQQKNKVIAVAAAEDHEVLEAVCEAINRNVASFILYGEESEIKDFLSGKSLLNDERIKIIGTSNPKEAAMEAVKAVSSGRADVLMKGLISTSAILKEVLNKEYGLRSGKVLSHVAAFGVPGFEQLIFVTDAGMNIAPDLKVKAEIVQNAVNVARTLGIEQPKVAPLAAVEVVNPDMQATLDCAALVQMASRGQIKNCIIDGPLALDNAVSIDAAKHKGIQSDVAGRADILMVPTIEVGNVLYKSLIYFAKAKVGAVIAGARAPIVLTSRADSSESKLYSIALAVLYSEAKL